MKKPDRRILCVLSWIFLTVPSVYYVPVLGKYGVYLFLCFFKLQLPFESLEDNLPRGSVILQVHEGPVRLSACLAIHSGFNFIDSAMVRCLQGGNVASPSMGTLLGLKG